MGVKLWWQFSFFFDYHQNSGPRHSCLRVAQLLSCPLDLQYLLCPAVFPFNCLQSYFFSVRVRTHFRPTWKIFCGFTTTDKTKLKCPSPTFRVCQCLALVHLYNFFEMDHLYLLLESCWNMQWFLNSPTEFYHLFHFYLCYYVSITVPSFPLI